MEENLEGNRGSNKDLVLNICIKRRFYIVRIKPSILYSYLNANSRQLIHPLHHSLNISYIYMSETRQSLSLYLIYYVFILKYFGYFFVSP